MQSSNAGGSGHRAPGSFNPNTSSTSSIVATPQPARQPGRISSLNTSPVAPATNKAPARLQRSRHVSPERPQLQTSFAHDSKFPTLNSSTPNLHYTSRPSASYIGAATAARGNSPLRLEPKSSDSDFRPRKHANSQGFFEPSLPSASQSNMGAMDSPQYSQQVLSASQVAAQAAMQHQRRRSQTMPVDQAQRRPSRGHASPPLLSVTEASGERSNGFGPAQYGPLSAGPGGPVYRNGLMSGTSVNPAATAASVVFSRSPLMSPNLAQADTNPFKEPEKPVKERSKMKLFSKPNKLKELGKDKEGKEKAPGSPNKLGFHTQQSRANTSSALNLSDPPQCSSSSMYSHTNSSQATIRASDSAATTAAQEKEGKEKKHHHFLSRQKQKLSGKDDHHLLLSSAKSNSIPLDPLEKPIYNFHLPPSPGPAATSFSKSMSGLDLRHGGRALREKKREEKSAMNQSFQELGLRESETSADWAGPSSLGSNSGAAAANAYPASIYGSAEAVLGGYGLQNMSLDDAWPLLKSKLLVVFQGEGQPLRMTIEDLNKLVSTHLQHCIRKRSPGQIIEDFRDIITTGFQSIEPRLRNLNDDEIIPALVEMWKLCYLKLVPYLMAVFLPLDLEFDGHGPLMGPAVARDFWGALPLSSLSNDSRNTIPVPAHLLLSVRRITLTTYRDIMIMPRFDKIMYLFSSMNLNNIGKASPRPGYSGSPNHPFTLSTSPPDGRPGTAGSLDPAFASFNSTGSTLLNGSQADSDSVGARSRGVSNVSFGSDQREAVYARANAIRAGNDAGPSSSQRDLNNQGAVDTIDIMGRMLQCMSILSSAGIIPGDGSEVATQRAAASRGGASGSGRQRGYSMGMVEDEAAQQKIDALCKALKLNWLGRGRTGRNRKGFVGARTRRDMPTVA